MKSLYDYFFKKKEKAPIQEQNPLVPSDFHLAFDLSFDDLYSHDGLKKIDRYFVNFLEQSDPDLYTLFKTLRDQALTDTVDPKLESDAILAVSPHLESFLGHLFHIHEQTETLKKRHEYLEAVFDIKRNFIQRYALRTFRGDVDTLDADSVLKTLGYDADFDEVHFARRIATLLENKDDNKQTLDQFGKYCAWAILSETGQKRHKNSVLFKEPLKLNTDCLVRHVDQSDGVYTTKEDHLRHRDGFKNTDEGFNRLQALAEAHYCIHCHHRGKDSCSKGMKPKKPVDDEKFIKNDLGIDLHGCPLEVKISEMNVLRTQGLTVSALATVIIDNPMLAGTGHRICNDCMKACIYQKQDPVNVPGIETQVLKEVLNLPWGFEIYSLLSKWNPLNFKNPLPKESSNYKVLVAGLGPAGYTLSHYLSQEGHTVVGIDGLKIEPLPPHITGVDENGGRTHFKPIRHIENLFADLDARPIGGFGGVSEYGITVRWNKNYLRMMRILLERHQNLRFFGGVRLGSNMTMDQAYDMGFDHIALCIGAGSPTLIPIKNGLSKGVRQASDFLMGLQLSGAFKKDSVANLQVRLPIVVIGGGLTAIDTATESLAYYPVQVEKFLDRFEKLSETLGEDSVWSLWGEEETQIAKEFLDHARQIRSERQRARAEKREPNIIALLREFGGASVCYRKTLQESPSYKLNHEEVEKALEEGIQFIENITPQEIIVDDFKAAKGLRVKTPNGEKTIDAKTILIAAGTKPNTSIMDDDTDNLNLVKQGQSYVYQAVDLYNNTLDLEKSPKPDAVSVITKIREKDQKAVSFFGDLHKSFAGSVVKAMASAKKGYPFITQALQKITPGDETSSKFLHDFHIQISAEIYDINRLTPTIIEIVVKAPLAARNFKPGQFYRFQNFERYAKTIDHTHLVMEGIALTGASVDKERGLISLITLEMGGSSLLCQTLGKGEKVVLMGPTGTPTHIPHNKKVMLVGGGLGNAVLFSIGQACRAQGCDVLYFAGYKKAQDRYKESEIEKAADKIIWACDEAYDFTPNRPQDHIFHGNIIEAMLAYAKGNLGDVTIPLGVIDQIIVIGSDGMMRAVSAARFSILKDYLNPNHTAIGSINSPMQCMMKEICAQCLQIHKNPETGEETVVYSCKNQDQDLNWVDFDHLHDRLGQNKTQEALSTLWVKKHLG